MYMDFGTANVTLCDTASSAAAIGGITSETYALTGTGSFTISSGVYEAKSGNFIDAAGTVTVNGGYITTTAGGLANAVTTANINGGYLSYNRVVTASNLGLVASGSVVYPDKKVLTSATYSINGKDYSGYTLGDPEFMLEYVVAGATPEASVTVDVYEADFDASWNQALILSETNSSVLVTITECTTEAKAVEIGAPYTMSAAGDGTAGMICLKGISFTRAGKSYDGNVFNVVSGRLVLSDSSIDGTMSDGLVATGSLITVASGAELNLKGSSGTSVINNVSVANALTNDTGAGIYIMTGGKIELMGHVSISGNKLYTKATADAEASTKANNLYLSDGSSVIISSNLTGGDNSIGVTYSSGIMAGYTTIGNLSESYLNELVAVYGDITKADLTTIQKAFSADGYLSYFLTYNSKNNTFMWDRESNLLPEAGMLRVEIIILIIGLMGFIMRNIKGIKAHKRIERYITAVAVICLLLGTSIGIMHQVEAKKLADENMESIKKVESSMKAAEKSKITQSKDVTKKDTITDTRTEGISDEKKESKNVPSVPQDGRNYYGIVEIPDLGIKLPVLSTYSDADMKTTPCVYAGDVLSNNLVIVGHNYDTQFGELNNISVPAKVTLHQMDGTLITYSAKSVEELNPDQIEEMISGDWDMTLFTCSYSGTKRVAIRCERVE
jgi:LPXTG-site transpeptidase (sortase) family protein